MSLLHLLTAELQKLPEARRYLIAYSGGVDSHVLLHALVQQRAQFPGTTLSAIHIDHGLHPQAVLWAEHCARVCAVLDVALITRKTDARAVNGESPEDAARRARYAEFTQELRPGDVLLTAHHQDDQAETLLLQLLRGAGPRGLAAMPAVAPLGAASLARPLLGVARDDLRAYADEQRLRWVDDPSNSDTRFDRNFLRAEIVPRLKQRWPAATATLARSAQHCAAAAELLQELAQQDLQTIGLSASSVSVSQLSRLSVARQRNLLRCWIEQCGLPLPQQRHLEHVLSDVLHAPPDGEPCVSWPGVEVRRYRDALYVMAPLPAIPATGEWAWSVDTPLHIEGAGTLRAQRVGGTGLNAETCRAGVRVTFRAGGERIKPAGRAHHVTLKHLFQDAGVPPWQRERLPLIFIGPSLAAVAGFWIADEFAARPGEDGVLFEWETDVLS